MRKLLFLFTAFCLVSSGSFCQNITFTATADKVVVVGQRFQVVYTLSGAEKGKDFYFPGTKDFDNLYGPIDKSSTFVSLINGKQETKISLTYTYIFLAKTEGTFTIAPATIKVGNSEYKSNELKIEVLASQPSTASAATNVGANNASQQAGQTAAQSSAPNEDVFLRMHVSKNSVYENEGFIATLKLYLSVNVTDLQNHKFPEYEGFTMQEIDLPTDRQLVQDSYNGRPYHSIILKQTVLFPQRSGKITIAPGKVDAIIQIRTQRRTRSFFDDFLPNAYETVRRPLTTAPVTIDVKELPPGKPASFSGAVGDYKMTSSISTNQLKTNDAVTVKVTISGNGNLKMIKNPEIVFPNDFEKLDPDVKTNIKASQNGVAGNKTIEYNAIPRYAGNFTIPASEFSYFDLKLGTYKTLKTDEFSLQVEQGETGGINAPIINASNKEDIRFLGKDIRYIKTDAADFHRGEFFFGTLKYLLFYIVPALLFLIFFWINRKQAAMNANIALVRTKKANKVASKRLKTAAKYLKQNNTELFYDETLRAVWGYLSDKLNIPVSALTKDNVDANLIEYGVNASLIQEFRDILDTAEFARFAPAQAIGSMDELYNATVQAIDKMENTIKK